MASEEAHGNARAGKQCRVEEISLQSATPAVHQLAEAIFSHGSLVQLSGQNRIFFLGMPQGWQKRSEYYSEENRANWDNLTFPGQGWEEMSQQ